MATMMVDTYNLISTLKSSGFSEDQAIGVSKVLNDIDLDHLVTKGDLKELSIATKADLKELRSETKSDIKDLEVRMTNKLGGLIIGGVGFLAALKFFG